MDDERPESFRVVSLKGFDQELYEWPVHVLQAEVGQIEYEAALVAGWRKEHPTCFHAVNRKRAEGFEGLLFGLVNLYVDIETGPIVLVGAMEVGFA